MIDEQTSWPSRDSVCLDCRTVLRDGEPCDGGASHRVRRLSDAPGREDYLSTVWGPPSVRAKIKRYGKAGAAGGTLGAWLEACVNVGDCGLAGAGDLGSIGVVIMVAAIAAGVAVSLVWLVSFIVRRVRLARNRPRPNGATSNPRGPKGGQVLQGAVIAAESQGLAPLSGKSCAGFYLELRDGRPRRAAGPVLRDGATLGFTLRTATGDEVRVPAGRIRVSELGDWQSSNPEKLGAHLSTVDGQRGRCSDLEAFPHDRAREAVIQVGDRLELIAELDRVPDPTAPETGYREAPRSIVVPRGTPVVRILSKA